MNNIKNILTLFFLPLFIVNSYGQSIENKFQKIIDSVYLKNKNAVGLLFHVASPTHNISWTSAVGFSDKSKTYLDKNQPVLIASNTKTFVATAVLKLIENGKITLNEPIKNLITCKTKRLLRQSYNLDKITIKQLLSHTSGIDDYVNDAYFEFVAKNPKHKWTRNEQLKLAVKKGKIIAKPGEKFKYADVNYLLLTEIIETKTKQPFYIAIRNLINYKQHKLTNTWFVNLENKPENTLALTHQYYDKYNWDSYNLDPSWDLFGGGGIASTTKDMALFFQALFTGKIIKNKDLLVQMHTYVLPKEQVKYYCLGIKKINFFGKEAYYHGGFWGTDVIYIPSLKTTITAFTLQKEMRILNATTSKLLINILENEK